MSLFRAQVRDAMVSALITARTLAGQQVYAPKDWPETPVQLPAIIVSMPAETKTSLTKGAPKFNTTATIVVLGRLIGTSDTDAEAKLENFADQIQYAILTDLAVLSLVEQFSTVETQIAITDQGEDQLGEISIAFGADFPEFFRPGIPQVLTDIKFTAATPGTQTVQADAVIPQT